MADDASGAARATRPGPSYHNNRHDMSSHGHSVGREREKVIITIKIFFI